MTVRASWLQTSGQTREETRLTLAALLTPTGASPAETPLRSRHGILPGGFQLTGTSAMQCSIGTGRAIIQGKDTRQGAYLVAAVSPETITIADGDPQFDRIDVIEVAVLDDTYDKTGVTDAVIRLVRGTPAAAPVAPSPGPGSALPLYQIRVPKGVSTGTGGIAWTSGGVTNAYWYTVALGGISPASGFNGAYPGQYRDASGMLGRWDGAAWVNYPKAIGGVAPNTVTVGSYVGQYRDNGVTLQRWDGSAWQLSHGTGTVLFGATQWQSTEQQTVVNNSWTVINLPTVEVDDLRGFNGTTTYVAPRTGWWRVNAHVTWQNDSQSGMRGSRVMVNGVGQSRMTWLLPAGNGAISVGGGGLLRLVAGDTLQLAGYQSSGGSVKTLGGSGYGCTLTAEWVKTG